MKEENILSKRIYESRKALGLTQEELARRLSVTPQSVSRWENGQSRPDIDMLPRLAAFFGITIDSLFGYHAENLRIKQYEDKKISSGKYQFGEVKKIVREILGLVPPVKPVSVLVMGCEDDTPIFLARNGYVVSAFDLSEESLASGRERAAELGVEVNFFRADILTYRIEKFFDVICAGGVTKYIPQKMRARIFKMIQENTSSGGLNVVSAAAEKNFSPTPADGTFLYGSAEVFGYYGRDWKFELLEEIYSDEEKYCLDNLIARKNSQ